MFCYLSDRIIKNNLIERPVANVFYMGALRDTSLKDFLEFTENPLEIRVPARLRSGTLETVNGRL